MDIFVDIFHSLPSLKLLFIDRMYDSTFQVDHAGKLQWAILLDYLPSSIYNCRVVYVYRIG